MSGERELSPERRLGADGGYRCRNCLRSGSCIRFIRQLRKTGHAGHDAFFHAVWVWKGFLMDKQKKSGLYGGLRVLTLSAMLAAVSVVIGIVCKNF